MSRRRTTPFHQPRAREISVLADFPNPWNGNAAAEYRAWQRDGNWHPHTQDFAAVAQCPNRLRPHLTEVITVDSVGGFFNAVTTVGGNGREDRPDRSIKRLNIFAHGAPGIVSLRGHIDLASDT